MLPTETRQGAICRDHHRTELAANSGPNPIEVPYALGANRCALVERVQLDS